MTTITSENVKFNGVLENAAVLRDDAGVKTLILTDDLSTADRAALDAFVAKYGSNPLAADTAGVLTAVFPTATVGATATGLNAVASATAGVATINIGGNKTGASASGLSSAVGTAGSQTINLAPGTVGTTPTGLLAGSLATAGRQSVAWTGLVGASATGLANDATSYTATITVDGVGIPIAVTGSDAQTFTQLVSEINTDLGSAATASIFSATELRIVSATTGTSSTVAITAGTLFTQLTGVGAIQTAVPGTNAVSPGTYTITVAVDGTTVPVSISGAAAQTITSLVSEINTDLGAAATASFVGGDIKITSATLGSTSTVRITGGTLFATLTPYVGVFPPADGDSTARTYTAMVTIDGTKQKSVRFVGTSGATLTNVVSEINTDLGADATASISNGNLIITSASTGAASSVEIADTGFLFASLTGYAGITSVRGVAPRVYTAFLQVDGVLVPISIQGSSAQTFTTLVSQINTDLGSAATAVLSGGSIRITSATTGLTSTIAVVNDDLFKHVSGFTRFVATQGAEDLVDEMKKVRVGAGSLFDTFDVKVVGSKPAVPPVPATLPKTQAFTYYGGSPAAWRYLEDDTLVNP